LFESEYQAVAASPDFSPKNRAPPEVAKRRKKDEAAAKSCASPTVAPSLDFSAKNRAPAQRRND
jgi:hypothetical protein